MRLALICAYVLVKTVLALALAVDGDAVGALVVAGITPVVAFLMAR